MVEQTSQLLWYVLKRIWPFVLLLVAACLAVLLQFLPIFPALSLLLIIFLGLLLTISLTVHQINKLLLNLAQHISRQQEDTKQPEESSLQTPAAFDILAQQVDSLVNHVAQEQVTRAYLDGIFQSMINTFMIVGANGRIQQVNPATTKLLGYSEEDIVGRPLGNILNARTFPLQDIGLVDLLSNEPLRNIEAAYIAQGGHEIPIIFSSSAIRNGDNHVTGIVCVAQDITGLKETEKALAEREKQFRLLFDEAPIGMAILDLSKTFLRVNQAFCELVGFSQTELLGNNMLTTLVHSNSLETTLTALEHLLAGDITTFTQETQYVGRSDQTVPIWLQAATLLDANNQPSQIVIQTVNITEQKQAEKERIEITNLLRKAAKLSETITSILEPMQLLKTAVSVLQQHFKLYHVHLFLLDETTNELVMLAGSGEMGETLVADTYTIPFDQEDSVVAWAARQQESMMVNDVRTAPYYLPNTLLPKTASEVAIPLVARDKLLGVLDVQDSQKNRFRQSDVDILNTVARQIAISLDNARLFENIQANESRLRRMNVELARSATAKDEFLASMSHELRTPLTGILGKAEVLHEGIFGPLNEKQAHAVMRIGQSGEQLLNLINDMLDIAKIEAGRLQLEIKRVDVQTVCEFSLRTIYKLAAEKNQTVTLHIDPNATTLRADERRFQQVLENLLSNAVKFTPYGGQIGLEVLCSLQEISFIIWDKGIGIEPNRLQEIFQLFQQMDGSLSRQHEGAGLGLALVYRLVKLHDGSITVESNPEQGSRFCVTLPWQAEPLSLNGEPMMSTPHSQQPFATQQERERPLILLVEDSRPIIETISIYLPRRGYDLIVAKDGLTGVDEATTRFPDLILMDIQLPHLDGIEAIRRIRTNHALQETPIIVLTGLDLQQDKTASMEAGANGFLRKPFKLNALSQILEQHLQ
ncbi:MAG: PAS domain S-box protein [Chloroflexota bacterium]